MKPLELTMQSFGSYVFQTIDFKVPKQNLFLVTGDTGSGKSTIFDAIVFALYGSVSSERNKKGYEDIWSQYADEKTKPLVELVFSENNGGKEEIYTVRRSLNRTASQGYTQKVVLTMPDGVDYKGNTTEINNKIAEITGLGKSQFMQIAMIAQGEFTEILRIDDTKEKNRKKEIFRKLFNTGIYEKIILKLKEMKDLKESEISEIRRICSSYVAVADCPENSDMSELRKRIITEKNPSDRDITAFAELLENYVVLTVSELEKATDKTKTAQESYNKIHDNLVRANEIKENFQKLEKAEKILSECRKAEPEIKKHSVLMEKIISAYEIKVFYERCTETEESLSETENKRKKLIESLPVIENNCIVSKNIEESALKSLNDAKDNYNKVFEKAKKFKEIEIMRKTTLNALKAYEKARKAYEEKNNEYNAKYRAFLDSQAGFIARELKDGMPCPVCGSTEHPKPCELDLNVNVTRETIENLRAETDRLRKFQEEKVTETRSLTDRLSDLEKTTDYNSATEAEKAFISAKSDMEEKSRLYNKAVTDCRKAERQKTECETLIEKYTEEIPLLENELKKRRIKYSELTATKSVDDWESVTRNYKKSYAGELKNKIEVYNRERYSAEGRYEQAKKAVENKEVPDTESLKKSEMTARETLLKEKSVYDRLIVASKTNSGICKELSEKSAKIISIGKESEMLNSLYQRLNGGQRGNKLSLETFVQRKYLEKILENANEHFLEMSGGQFEFHLKDLESAVSGGRDYGLDLMVYSTVTDTEREVKTLSGGESFMGALSLALGMAEQIKENSSSVNLDIMFIDEGFGSLDEHSRRQAVNVLKELAGGERLTGIISHVTEMKTEIENILVVKRNDSGSSAEWHIS